MEAQDVLDVLAVLDDAGVSQAWLDGGWGVDALLGEQHRDHGDADVVVPADELDVVIGALGEVGFSVVTDHRPTRMELMDRKGRTVDLHPVSFDDHGDGWQRGAAPGGGDAHYPSAALTYGWVGGKKVTCVGPEVQLAHHTGYAPRPQDRDDVARIRERFVLPAPADDYR